MADVVTTTEKSVSINDQTVIHFNDTRRWKNFLQSIFQRFSKYDIQKNTSKYNVYYLDDWGERDKRQGIKIDRNNFQLFLEKIAPLKVHDHNFFKNKELSNSQIEELNYVLNLSLNFKIEVKCLTTHKIIKGNNIAIKSIIKHINLDNTCEPGKEKLKGVIIFALDTVFIDRDIVQPQFPITIISPKWEIIGQRTIDVSGFNGDHFLKKTDPIIEDIEDDEEHVRPGANGKSGVPGLPGGPGGIFFGIGEKFIDGQHLTIIANGGIGGTGENGKNGTAGENGKTAEAPIQVECTKTMCDNHMLNGFRCSQLSCNEKEVLGFIKTTLNCVYEIFGDEGEKGGDGGAGGRGGKGGTAGNIMLLELNGGSEISQYQEEGRVGKNGTGGFGGLGGKHGDNLILSCASHLFREKHETAKHIPSHVVSLPGRNGITGGNAKFIENPKKFNNVFKHYKIIDEYKAYLRANLRNYYGTPTLIRFLNHLDTNRNIKNMYNTLALYEELETLEMQFYKLNVRNEFLPFYRSLLSRILEYAKNPKINERSDQYRKALSYLYTSCLMRMQDMENNLESTLITNIEEHLTSVNSDIEKLKVVQMAKNKADVINFHRKEYKIKVDVKIAEAQKIIQEQVNPEIDEMNAQLDQDIIKLVKEVQAKEAKETALIDKQKDQAKKLQNLLGIKAVFEVVQFASQAVGVLGPVGAFIGGAVGEVNSVTKSLVLDKENFDAKLMELPQSVIDQIHAGKNLISSMMQEKIDRFEKFLDHVSNEVGESDHHTHLSTKVDGIRKRLHEINPENLNFNKVKSLEKEFKNELEQASIKIKQEDKTGESKTLSEKLDLYIDRFQKVYQFGVGVFELMNKIKENKAEVDEMTEAIEENQDNFRQLKEYEEEIYNTISPTLNNMKDDINEFSKSLSNKSSVVLDVSKYKIRSMLTNVKQQIQKMVTGFQVNDDLMQCIDKLNQSMDLLIEVYEHIQKLHEKKTLANYIADVSSAPANSISVTDPKLDSAINRLEILIRSNLILERYQISFDAFKQFVFPFANLYLDDTVLPSALNMNNNLSNLAFQVTERIDSMIDRLKKYKSSITDHKNGIGYGVFSSNGTSTKPFFKWENKKNKILIKKLLSGKEVLMKADINQSDVSEDAIKFSTLALKFKSNNETKTKQSDIYEVLKGFKIDLKHLGRSYYRYNNTIYVIPTSQYNLWYNLEKDAKGEPVKQGDEWFDVGHGDFLLSPYATWQVKLTPDNDKNITFKNLTKFETDIDLELEGYATFVLKKKNSKPLNLEQYYKTYEEDHIAGNSTSPESLKEKIDQIYQNSNGKTNLESDHFTEIGDSTLSDGWFSWMKDFKILPGAEAFSIEETHILNHRGAFFKLNNFESSENKLGSFIKSPVDTEKNSYTGHQDRKYFFQEISSYFGKIVDKVKKIVFEEKLVLFNFNTDNILINNDPRKIMFSYDKNQMLEAENIESSDLSENFAQNDHNTLGTTLMNIDFVHGNLILAQYVLGKFFGTNQAIQSKCYLTPKDEQKLKVQELSAEYASIKQSFNSEKTKYQNDKNLPKWYQDICKE